MKTAEEVLNDFVNDGYELSIKDALEAMKIYSNQKLDEAASYANGHRTKQAILNLKYEL